MSQNHHIQSTQINVTMRHTNSFDVSRSKQVTIVLKLWEWNVPLGARFLWTRMTWLYSSLQLSLHTDSLLPSCWSTKPQGSLKN